MPPRVLCEIYISMVVVVVVMRVLVLPLCLGDWCREVFLREMVAKNTVAHLDGVSSTLSPIADQLWRWREGLVEGERLCGS